MHRPSTPLCPRDTCDKSKWHHASHTVQQAQSARSQESAGLSRRMEIKREWNLLILTSLARHVFREQFDNMRSLV
jgi:hypothetical protein